MFGSKEVSAFLKQQVSNKQAKSNATRVSKRILAKRRSIKVRQSFIDELQKEEKRQQEEDERIKDEKLLAEKENERVKENEQKLLEEENERIEEERRKYKEESQESFLKNEILNECVNGPSYCSTPRISRDQSFTKHQLTSSFERAREQYALHDISTHSLAVQPNEVSVPLNESDILLAPPPSLESSNKESDNTLQISVIQHSNEESDFKILQDLRIRKVKRSQINKQANHNDSSEKEVSCELTSKKNAENIDNTKHTDEHTSINTKLKRISKDLKSLQTTSRVAKTVKLENSHLEGFIEILSDEEDNGPPLTSKKNAENINSTKHIDEHTSINTKLKRISKDLISLQTTSRVAKTVKLENSYLEVFIEILSDEEDNGPPLTSKNAENINSTKHTDEYASINAKFKRNRDLQSVQTTSRVVTKSVKVKKLNLESIIEVSSDEEDNVTPLRSKNNTENISSTKHTDEHTSINAKLKRISKDLQTSQTSSLVVIKTVKIENFDLEGVIEISSDEQDDSTSLQTDDFTHVTGVPIVEKFDLENIVATSSNAEDNVASFACKKNAEKENSRKHIDEHISQDADLKRFSKDLKHEEKTINNKSKSLKRTNCAIRGKGVDDNAQNINNISDVDKKNQEASVQCQFDYKSIRILAPLGSNIMRIEKKFNMSIDTDADVLNDSGVSGVSSPKIKSSKTTNLSQNLEQSLIVRSKIINSQFNEDPLAQYLNQLELDEVQSNDKTASKSQLKRSIDVPRQSPKTNRDNNKTKKKKRIRTKTPERGTGESLQPSTQKADEVEGRNKSHREDCNDLSEDTPKHEKGQKKLFKQNNKDVIKTGNKNILKSHCETNNHLSMGEALEESDHEYNKMGKSSKKNKRKKINLKTNKDIETPRAKGSKKNRKKPTMRDANHDMKSYLLYLQNLSTHKDRKTTSFGRTVKCRWLGTYPPLDYLGITSVESPITKKKHKLAPTSRRNENQNTHHDNSLSSNLPSTSSNNKPNKKKTHENKKVEKNPCEESKNDGVDNVQMGTYPLLDYLRLTRVVSSITKKKNKISPTSRRNINQNTHHDNGLSQNLPSTSADNKTNKKKTHESKKVEEKNQSQGTEKQRNRELKKRLPSFSDSDESFEEITSKIPYLIQCLED